MTASSNQFVPTLSDLPVTLPREGAIEIELEQGVLVFRVSEVVQSRIEALLDKHRASSLTPAEEQELSQYEDLDDFLSYLNRLTRNLTEESRNLAAQTRARIGLLTDMERRVAMLYSEGMTPKQIAGNLSVSVTTVYRHLQSIRRKLVVTDRSESTPTATPSGSPLREDEAPREEEG